MPQIQYPAYTQPTAFTPPTTDKMGWHPSVPDVVRYESRGRLRPDAYQPHEQTTGATVFTPEKWAVPGSTIGTAYVPHNPQQFQSRLDARGGGNYRTALYSPWFTYDFETENLLKTSTLLKAAYYGPDNPQQFIFAKDYRLRGGGYVALLDTQSHAVFAVEQWKTALGWGAELPDDPRLGRRPLTFVQFPSVARGEAPEKFAATLQWGAELPDDPRLGRRPTTYANYVSNVARTDVVVSLAPTLLWSANYPDTTRRAVSLLTAGIPYLFRGESPVQLPAQPTVCATLLYSKLSLYLSYSATAVCSPHATLQWSAVYPDTTRRASQPVAAAPSLFMCEAIEQLSPLLQWSVVLPADPYMGRRRTTYASYVGVRPEVIPAAAPTWFCPVFPDTTRRLSLAVSAIPSLFRGEALEQFAPTLLWSVTYPDTTRRLVLPVAELPSYFHTDSVEQLAPKLLWSATYPDTTRRLALPTANVPSTFWDSAVEYLAPTLQWGVKVPDDPRLGRRVVTFATYPNLFRGESVEQFAPTLLWSVSYPDTTRRLALVTASIPSLFWDSANENLAPTLRWSATFPDTTSRASLHPSRHPYLFKGESVEQFNVPPLGWGGQYPDTTRRSALQTAQHPVSVFQIPIAAVPNLSWGNVYPDTTRRLALLTTLYPYLFKGEAIEQFAVPPLSWMGLQPDRVPTLRPQTRIDGLTQVPQALQVVPTLWSSVYPNTTSRLALATALHPFLFRGEAVEQFRPTLLWSAVYPDTTRRLSLATADIPSVFRPEALSNFAPTLLWSVVFPDTTRRLSLATAEIPSAAFRPESLQNFGATLQWSAVYPDTTRRLSLSTAEIQAFFKGESVEQFRTPLGAAFFGPDTTRRASLPQSTLNFVESLVQLIVAPTLSWGPTYPNTTSRRVQLVAAIPFTFRGNAIIVTFRFVKVINEGSAFPDIMANAVSFSDMSGSAYTSRVTNESVKLSDMSGSIYFTTITDDDVEGSN